MEAHRFTGYEGKNSNYLFREPKSIGTGMVWVRSHFGGIDMEERKSGRVMCIGIGFGQTNASESFILGWV